MIVAALQARMGSTRLPGKVVADIGGRPMLVRQIERIVRSARIDRLCVATSDDAADDRIAELAANLDIACHRGPALDVLERIWQVGRRFEASHIVRLTGDCPLTDPGVVDTVIERHLADGNDLTTNAIDRSFPDGLDVEIATFAALTAARASSLPGPDREHVMPYLYRCANGFRVGAVHAPGSYGAERWTVDFAEDLEFVRAVFAAFRGREATFSYTDVLALLEREPGLRTINAARREGAVA
jgi:spore coat polysaccharide biosynthesis protein SpsF